MWGCSCKLRLGRGKVIKQDTEEEYQNQIKLADSIDGISKKAYQKLVEITDQLKQLDVI